ncbi:hypothetical protein NIE88_01190 [Sporolactobacillus shoreicorticis]|uniref:DUF4149 domain-containing protein n=1 Tax=Sporolactobacillus shoreicorticis TaxID=1923877 RepID=A0ABW5S4T7_9BACL|nr:hypothetical protein [Sporolactobacillus shoreicorticis]MCO7124397.1 hypothetical protein [Sporolactobacillus shoreicorticis]
MKNRMQRLLLVQVSFKKLYGFLTVFTLMTPCLYGSYLFLTMVRDGKDFKELLVSHPLYSVMFTAVLLNVIWGYLLFRLNGKLDDQDGRNYSYGILGLLTIAQLLVGNIAIAIMAAFVMIHADAQLKDALSIRNILHERLFSAIAAGLVLFSLLCSFALIRLTFFA